MIDQLSNAHPDLTVVSQTEWLQKWEIDELVSEGMQYWEVHKSAPDIAAMKMRSRANEAQALTGQDGLGGFSVLELNF